MPSGTGSFKLGRNPRRFDPRVPHLSALLADKVPAPPPRSVDYTKGMGGRFGVMLNDTLGDCTCAAYYHARQVWTFHAGREITEPDDDVKQLYVEACGYNPKSRGEGPGGNEQDVLTFLHRKGAPIGPNGKQRHKIAAFVEVDPRNIDDVKRTIADLGVAYIGLNLPRNVYPLRGDPPRRWTVAKRKQQIAGGHAVVLTGYDRAGAGFISWGKKYKMTWEFFTTYVDEAYGITDSAWVQRKSNVLGGLTMADLSRQMEFLK